MTLVSPLPATGDVFLDERNGTDGDRSLRVSWHHETGLVVLSLWRAGRCAGTFRLEADQVPDLIGVLRAGLGEAYHQTRRAATG